MQKPGKALQLILFTDEGTLLEDLLLYQPDYRVGDIIHPVGSSGIR